MYSRPPIAEIWRQSQSSQASSGLRTAVELILAPFRSRGKKAVVGLWTEFGRKRGLIDLVDLHDSSANSRMAKVGTPVDT